MKVTAAVAALVLAVAVPVAGARNTAEPEREEPAGPWWHWQPSAEGMPVDAGLQAEPVADLEALLDDYGEFAEGLADQLEDAGFEPELHTIPVVVWDWTDEEANRAALEYLEEAQLPFPPLGEGFFEGEFPFDEGSPFDGESPFGEGAPGLEDWLPPEVLDELDASADALAEFLEERGIDFEIEEGPFGVRWVIPDLGDPEAREALEEFAAGREGLGFRHRFGEGPRFGERFERRFGGLLRDLFGSRR
jgi:hypothetical protein